MSDENKKETAKKLTIAEVKKQNKVLDEFDNYQIDVNGVTYNIKVDVVFRKSKQIKLLDDLIEFINEGNDRPYLLDSTTPYTSLLLIKYFTDISIPKDIDEAMDYLEILIDLELINEVINLMPEAELEKIYELLHTTVERMTETIAETEEESKRLANEVENQELKDVLLDEFKPLQ